MRILSRIVGLGFLVLCANAGAGEIERGSSRDVATKPAVKQTLSVEQYSPTQVVCIKRRRTGSRVERNVCQTIAAWRQELNEKAMRQYLIRPQGKRAAWE